MTERGHFRRNGYDPKKERAYHLGIVLGNGASACAVHDLQTGEPQFLSWCTDDEAVLQGDIPHHPRSTSFVLLPEWSTLIPDGALTAASGTAYLGLVHGRLPSTPVHEEPLGAMGATCLYVREVAAERTVLDRFPNARSLPLQAVLVRSAQLRATAAPVLLMHRGADRTDICITRGQQVLLSTSYPVRTAEDLLYFCLLAAERCDRRPEEVQLHHGGTHLTAGDRSLLMRYFTDTRPACGPPWPGLSGEGLATVDRWSAAIDQFACVS